MESSWEWRRRYRVWEANRRTFLYPENWIEPEEGVSARTQNEVGEVAKVARQKRTSVLLTSATEAATLLTGRAVAMSLGRDLYRVGLHGVVSKYLSDTEKNLDRVFAEADATGHPILLFDEADALLGKRPEVSYFLERVEAFDGVAILATNSKREIVEPLLRRFAFVIDPAVTKPRR